MWETSKMPDGVPDALVFLLYRIELDWHVPAAELGERRAPLVVSVAQRRFPKGHTRTLEA